jgi:phage protein D
MANGSPTSGLYASRPALTLDGVARPDLVDPGLYSLIVEETTLGLFRAEALFDNWGPKGASSDFLYFDRDIFDFGKQISFDLGPSGSSRTIFSGRITAMEAHYPATLPPRLTILAEDRFLDLRMHRRTRSWENTSDSDVVKQIAGDNGLTTQVNLTGPTYKVLAQVNQSDLAFLRERMSAVDGEIWVDGKTLNAALRKDRNAGTVTLTYGQELLEFSVTADLAHQRTSVKVSGWDVGGKAAIDEQAAVSDISGEFNGGLGGSDILGTALTQRTERIVTAIPLTSDEAQSMAKARYRGRARKFVRGTATAVGTAAIRVGEIADLQGLGKLFTGQYYVTRCRHSFDLLHGYRTNFDVERPAIGQ